MIFRSDIISASNTFVFTRGSLNHTLALSISTISPHLPLQVQSRLGSCGAPASVPGETKGQKKKAICERVL